MACITHEQGHSNGFHYILHLNAEDDYTIRVFDGSELAYKHESKSYGEAKDWLIDRTVHMIERELVERF